MKLLSSIFVAAFLFGWFLPHRRVKNRPIPPERPASEESSQGARLPEDLINEALRQTYIDNGEIRFLIDHNGNVLISGIEVEAVVYHPHEPPTDLSKRCRESAAIAAAPEIRAGFVICMETNDLAAPTAADEGWK